MGVLAETGVQFIDRKDATRENGILQWNDRFDLISRRGWSRGESRESTILGW